MGTNKKNYDTSGFKGVSSWQTMLLGEVPYNYKEDVTKLYHKFPMYLKK